MVEGDTPIASAVRIKGCASIRFVREWV